MQCCFRKKGYGGLQPLLGKWVEWITIMIITSQRNKHLTVRVLLYSHSNTTVGKVEGGAETVATVSDSYPQVRH